jgi:hypothetical protein
MSGGNTDKIMMNNETSGLWSISESLAEISFTSDNSDNLKENSNPKRIKECLTGITQSIVQLEIDNDGMSDRSTRINLIFRDLAEVETLIGMFTNKR